MSAVRSRSNERGLLRCQLRALHSGVLSLLFALGCGEGLPSFGLDFSKHDRCTGAPPQNVDASASEIQCRVDDYVFKTLYDGVVVDMEQGSDVPGSPICCEVCALAGTADDVCESTCKHELCSRARGSHVSVAQELSGLPSCAVTDCGFAFDACMDTNHLHVQAILTDIDGEAPQLYALQASCYAHADDATHADGLFVYLEQLDGIPGAEGKLTNVQDVVGYCVDIHSPDATGAPQDPSTTGGSYDPSLDDGADSTGAGAGEEIGDDPEPGPGVVPDPCGPHAVERYWVRPTNNFGAWNEGDAGVLGLGDATHQARMTGGGVSYTMFPCGGAPDADCIRLDRLSVQITDAGSRLFMQLSMVDASAQIPVTPQGHFDILAGALRFSVRHGWDAPPRLFTARNVEPAHGYIDASAGTIRIQGLDVSWERELAQILVLEANLANSQPRTQIVESRSPVDGSLLLVAKTFDTDLDPIAHLWTIPGVGTWRGDTITPVLPPGRHAVILYADDIHRARGVAARWLEVVDAAEY